MPAKASNEVFALVAIRFVSMMAKTDARLEAAIPKNVRFEFKISRPKVSLLAHHVTSECLMVAEVAQANGEVFASAKAKAEVGYSLLAKPPVELPAEWGSFVSVHSYFSAWPYWRELVSSAFGRMGLPPVIVPMVTFQQLDQTLSEHRATSETAVVGIARSEG